MFTQRPQIRTFELLEQRALLDAHGVLWGADARLSLSFVPDGTEVGPHASQLFEKFDALAPRDQWQEAILRGFQTWAQNTNADIAVVQDDGSPLGTDGATAGDLRFGDVRVTAIPMQDGLFATSVRTDEFVDGTWVGDVFFNSQADIHSLDDLFAVALHEAGHVFGLDHTHEPNSPLFTHGLPESTELTANDIQLLQELYGKRRPDTFEQDRGEGDLAEIELDEDDTAAPGLIFADIGASNDVDLFRVELPEDGGSGRVRVQLFTEGISLLRAQLAVEDNEGRSLGVVGSDVGTDQALELLLEDTEELVIRVAADGEVPYHIGGYTVAVSFPDDNTYSEEVIEAVAKSRLRDAEQEDIRLVFRLGGGLLLDSEVGLNDLPGDETELSADDTFEESTVFVAHSSIGSAVDVDRYRLALPANETADVWTLSLNSETSGLRTRFLVTDGVGNRLPTEVLVSSDGTYIAQVAGVSAAEHVNIQVQRHARSTGTRGNYELLIRTATEPKIKTSIADGFVSAQQSSSEHFVHIDRPQLFQLGVEGSSNGNLLMELFDASGAKLLSMTSFKGEFETRSLLLLEGNYRIRISSTNANGQSYRVFAATIDIPLGIDPVDPTEDPFCVDIFDCLLRLGDLNGDGTVSFEDFLVLGNNFGTENATLADGDLNGDGLVGFADFLILTENFGRTV